MLAGQGDVEQLVRLENLASRAVRRLGIDFKAAPPKASGVAGYLAAQAANPPPLSPDDEEDDDDQPGTDGVTADAEPEPSA